MRLSAERRAPPGKAASGFRCSFDGQGRFPPGTASQWRPKPRGSVRQLAAAAGIPDLKKELLTGKKMGDMTYKVHLDGFNNLDYWTGKTEKSARRCEFLLR